MCCADDLEIYSELYSTFLICTIRRMADAASTGKLYVLAPHETFVCSRPIVTASLVTHTKAMSISSMHFLAIIYKAYGRPSEASSSRARIIVLAVQPSKRTPVHSSLLQTFLRIDDVVINDTKVKLGIISFLYKS